MKTKILILITFCIFGLSTTTFFLILNYLDPYIYTLVGIISITISFILSLTSFFALILYLIKKIFYIGDVYIQHFLYSFRQGFFISIFFLGVIFFKIIDAPIFIASFFLFILFIFLELFIKNLEN